MPRTSLRTGLDHLCAGSTWASVGILFYLLQHWLGKPLMPRAINTLHRWCIHEVQWKHMIRYKGLVRKKCSCELKKPKTSKPQNNKHFMRYDSLFNTLFINFVITHFIKFFQYLFSKRGYSSASSENIF